jgi:RNA polymerase sigma factor (sigma-70 family)
MLRILRGRGKDSAAAGHGRDVHDRRRLERLFRDHGADVLAYALRRTDPATAEEVVAEVFVVAWRRPERVPAAEPVLWLYAVARRLLANERRAARRRAALTDVLGLLAARREPAAPEPDGDAGALRDALAALRAADREVLMLTAWEGLDGGQAAVVLGCSPQAVHTRLHRARARLAAELERRGHRPPAVRDRSTAEVTR